MNPIQKMLRSVGVYTKSYTEFRRRAYRIHTEPCKQKTPIRYETELDTLVIGYRVNGDKEALMLNFSTEFGILLCEKEGILELLN